MPTGLVLEPEKFDEIARKVRLVRDGLATVLEQSLRRASKGMRTDASRSGRDIYGLKHRTIINDLKALRPWFARADFSAGVDIAPKARKRLSLMLYGARPDPSGRRGGASALVRKDKGRFVIPGSFMARQRAGTGKDAGLQDKKAVFRRKGKKRLPIKKLTGPGVVSVLRRKKVQADVRGKALERLHKQLEYNAENLLRRKGLKYS